ncbi:hypothetical protein [Diaphorobacter aerolatus]|uniref:hypothetical protein n=1 Tax=Diaphorobacter aerolatus TaxID=1288495 RepID=UPI001D00426E|nr:hypothetical protein [Diaphorobacter aerolatus]
MAGSASSAQLGIWQQDTLALPAQISLFEESELNRALYLWLAALAACFRPGTDWLNCNMLASARALRRFPGLRTAHGRLLDAQLAERPKLSTLRGNQARAELALQLALRDQLVSTTGRALTPQDVAPVWMWLVLPERGEGTDSPATRQSQTQPESPSSRQAMHDACRRAAKRVEDERNGAPLVMFFRAESILSWAEFTKVNRADDDEDDGKQLEAANDMDEIAIANDGSSIASRVKFDLDLPSAAHDDQPLGNGMKFPEWDWRQGRLLADHCAVQLVVSKEARPYPPDARLRAISRRMRRHLDLARQAPSAFAAAPTAMKLTSTAGFATRSRRVAAPSRRLQARHRRSTFNAAAATTASPVWCWRISHNRPTLTQRPTRA